MPGGKVDALQSASGAEEVMPLKSICDIIFS